MKSEKYLKILNYTLIALKNKDYKGWDKFDATLSPLFNYSIFNNKYFRFIIQQIIKESPVNLRKLFFIEKNINIKAIALLSLAYYNVYHLTKKQTFWYDCLHLESILFDNRSPIETSYCWGHNFKIQTTSTTLSPYAPNVTNTFYSSLIYLELCKTNDAYLEVLNEIYKFFQNDLFILLDEEDQLAYSYFTIPQKNIVYNIQGMIATFYLKYSVLKGSEEAKSNAFKSFNYLKSQMNSDYTWNYHDGNGYNKIDNYHSAYVLDSFWELYQYTRSDEDLDFYLKCLKVFEEKFWGPNGEPFWSVKYKYPYDIHSAASGIIAFAKASIIDRKYLEKSKQILNWTIENMYREKENDFIYRIFGPIKYNYSFIRWSSAWMCYAISEYLKYENR